MIVVMAWLVAYLLEIALYIGPIWRLRRLVVLPIICMVVITTFVLGLALNSVFIAAFLPLLVFRVFSLSRIYFGRMHEKYLRRVTFRTTIALMVGHIAVLLLLEAQRYVVVQQFWSLLVIALPVATTVMLLTLLRTVKKLNFTMPKTFLADKDLPTVTVAIPARNETRDLEECIRSVLASDYPKLEVLVLDDCSQAGRTAEIIRSFAHGGVRFIKGAEPSDRWLAKNQAYEKLFQESTGHLVLFCGVDVRFGSGTIRAMVNLLKHRNKKMMSVLPLRFAGSARHTVFQPMRYWWELALPRRLFNRPAVLSTCWLIERQTLKKLGGFAAVSHQIIPEGYFARKLVHSDAYSFVRSGEDIDVRTQKSMEEQRSTSIRTRYPLLRKRPENVLLLLLAEFVVFVGPLISIGLFAWHDQSTLIYLPIAALIELLLIHNIILHYTNPTNAALALLTFPVAIVTELAVNIISMVRYEFGTIEWKDRNVCIPVMHAIPHLPKLPEKTI